MQAFKTTYAVVVVHTGSFCTFWQFIYWPICADSCYFRECQRVYSWGQSVPQLNWITENRKIGARKDLCRSSSSCLFKGSLTSKLDHISPGFVLHIAKTPKHGGPRASLGSLFPAAVLSLWKVISLPPANISLTATCVDSFLSFHCELLQICLHLFCNPLL